MDALGTPTGQYPKKKQAQQPQAVQHPGGWWGQGTYTQSLRTSGGAFGGDVGLGGGDVSRGDDGSDGVSDDGSDGQGGDVGSGGDDASGGDDVSVDGVREGSGDGT